MTSTLTALLNQPSPDNKRKGAQWERGCKFFLQTDPYYSHELEEVWLWKDWPDRWKEDEAGIDLVARHRDGTLWAIQAKAYQKSSSVTKRDMDSFLSESAGMGDDGKSMFSYRLLIATTDELASHAKDVMHRAMIKVGVLGRSQLEAAEVVWPASWSDLRAPKPEPKSPMPHQLEAISDVIKGFARSDRGQLIMPCSSGKTFTSLCITEKLAAQRTLVVVPTLDLLGQTQYAFMANRTTDFEVMAVCSDESVRDDDDVVLSDTVDLGFPVTTDAKEIASFLRGWGPRVVFCTYQSSPVIAKAMKLGKVPAFDLVIADEAHRTAGRVASQFSTVLDTRKIRATRRLFMTATPRNFAPWVLKQAEERGDDHASMDDVTIYGPRFHQLSFAKAIRIPHPGGGTIVTDYQIAVIGVNDATYREWAENGLYIRRDGTVVQDARELAGQIGLLLAMRDFDMHSLITFHGRINRARDFAETLDDVRNWMPKDMRPSGKLWAKHASGKMPTSRRRQLLNHLGHLGKGERGVLSNARCLGEGIDVPALDGVAVIDPRRSTTDIHQIVGRATRWAPAKTISTIIIPVFVGTGVDTQAALADSAFAEVWETVWAMRAHDEVLAEQLDECRRQMGALPKGTRLPIPAKIVTNLAELVDEEFARSFELKLVWETTAPWEEYIGAAERYYAENENLLVPQDYVTAEGLRLGSWLATQRRFKAAGDLLPEREEQLGNLPGHVWNVFDEAFEEGYRHALAFRKEHGHLNVKQKYVAPDGYPLGRFLTKQKAWLKREDCDPERRRRLGELDVTLPRPMAKYDTDICAAVENGQRCDQKRYANGYCITHNGRMKMYGTTELPWSPPTPETCTAVENGKKCEKKHHSSGYCQMHYARMQKYGSVELPERPTNCTAVENGEKCERKRVRSAKYCSMHDQRMRKHGTVELPVRARRTCSVIEDGKQCDGKYLANGFCQKHSQRMRKHGTVELPVRARRTCSAVENGEKCEKKYCAGGYCKTHYNRMKQYGTTDLPPRS